MKTKMDLVNSEITKCEEKCSLLREDLICKEEKYAQDKEICSKKVCPSYWTSFACSTNGFTTTNIINR